VVPPGPIVFPMSNLEKIAAAMESAGSRTPGVVIDAFAQACPEVFGLRLRKFSFGAFLALEKLGHPFVAAVAGSKVEATAHDIATALHVLVTPSAVIFQQIEAGTIRDAIMETADRADLSNLAAGTDALLAHIERALEPLMPMRVPEGAAQKKTAASAGG